MSSLVMMVLFLGEFKMSSHMQVLQQHQIIKSGQKKAGGHFQNAKREKTKSVVLNMVGKQYGKLIVSSPDVIRKEHNQRAYIQTLCVTCGTVSEKDLQSVLKKDAGCRICAAYHQAPEWLIRRCNSARARCENQKDAAYPRYGMRGIEFRFQSPLDMAMWIIGHLGLDRSKQIDRINNDGHYEMGNLRLVTQQVNQCNTRGFRATALMHKFRMMYPEVRYADSTIVNLLTKKMSFEQINERFYKKSHKPKGVYGTFSIPDQEIASLSPDY